MAIQKTEAILLARRDIRETSSLVVFYTEVFGKIKGLIKGVRGPAAKSGLYLREFAKYDIVFYEKRKSDTSIITQCDLKDAYIEIADEIQRRMITYHALELIDKLTPLEEPSAEIYRLLDWFLDTARAGRNIATSIIIFELKLLEYAGFLPELHGCSQCSQAVSASAYFSARLGGLLCANCRDADIQAIQLSRGAYASINMIRKQAISQLARSTITRGIAGEIKTVLQRFVAYHLGEHLKTQEVMKQLLMQEIA